MAAPTNPFAGLFEDLSFGAQIDELQSVSHGRKFGLKDRRPLDPPPIVQLRVVRQVPDPRTGTFELMEVDDIPPQATIGLICVSELIPADNRQQVTPQESFGHGLPIAYASAPAASYPSPTAPFSPAPSAIPHPEWPLAAGRSQAYISQPEMSTGSEVYGIPPAFVNPVQMEHMPYWGGLPGTDAIPPMVLHSAPVFDPYATSGAAPLASEPDNTKGALFGTMVAQVQAIPYNGKNSLVFVFGDLSVRQEGVFRLRYKFFDIFSHSAGGGETPVLAECLGAPFRVYGSKGCPPMQASTDLTRLVAEHGAKVNTRRRERTGSIDSG